MVKTAVKFATAAILASSLQASWAKPSSECAPLIRASLAKANASFDKSAKGDPDGFWSVAKTHLDKAKAAPWESMTPEQVAKLKPVIKKEQDALVVDIGKLADKRALAKQFADKAKQSGSGEDINKSKKADRLVADYTLFYDIRKDVLKSQADYAACVGG